MPFPDVPNPDEIATLVVGGKRFDDWETVWIQHRFADSHPLFRFTAVERDPIPEWWGKLQFKPGDECAIYLAGMLAITGVIIVRQVSYDGTNHGVMLQGKGLTWYASTGHIKHKNGDFSGKNFMEVATEVIGPFGIGIKTIGNINPLPYEALQLDPGKNLWDFLEGIARPRGIVLGSDHLGNILVIDYHSFSPTYSLIEGFNILQAQVTITAEYVFSEYIARGQTAGTDSKKGTDASEQEASVGATAKRYRPLIVPAEQPVWNLAELGDRAKAEYTWNEGTQIDATITVQGWRMAPNTGLWRAGDKIVVKSPMAMLNMPLKIKVVTFTQDRNSGTLTQL